MQKVSCCSGNFIWVQTEVNTPHTKKRKCSCSNKFVRGNFCVVNSVRTEFHYEKNFFVNGFLMSFEHLSSSFLQSRDCLTTKTTT